jgi:hypothetical protein
MIKAYINYPNPHITLHKNPECSTVGQQHKEGQRIISLDIGSLSSELSRFKANHYKFGSDAKTNDMRLDINFADYDFERAVVEYIKKLLSQHYMPFCRAKIIQHC